MAFLFVPALCAAVDMPRTDACEHNTERHARRDALRHLPAHARSAQTFRFRTCSGESTVGNALGKVAGQSRLK